MNRIHKPAAALLLLLGLTSILIINAHLQLKAGTRELTKAVFTVA
jgi:hypothetical protein